MDKYIERIENDEVVKLIKPYILYKDVLLVGGFVRDILMGQTSYDRDIIICEEDVELFAKNLAENINGYFIELDSENKIYRVVLDDKVNYIDITCPIENNLAMDLKRRDLTINAIAYDINSKRFVDMANGIQDLKDKKIRGIYNKNFEDDPLRLLRIFRFYSKTGFEIDIELIKLVKKMFKRINEPAKERVNVELLKLFEGKYAANALMKMDECGLLDEIFPIVREVKSIPPNSHHHLDLFHHSIETVKFIQELYEEAQKEVKTHLEVEKFATVKELALLKLSGFLHDIGKPETWTIEEETGRHRFIKHDEVGSNLVVPILRELKFSKKQIEYVKTLIKYHIYPSCLVNSQEATEKAYMKFYRKMEDFVIPVIILAKADRLSARGVAITDEMVNENLLALNSLLEGYLKKREEIKPLEKLLDGVDIMELLNISAGPVLGQIINELKEAQMSGIVNTKEEAEEFIIKNFGSNS